MLQTLYYIPNEIAGVPVFGFGWLLAIWTVGSAVFLIWQTARQGLNAEILGHVPLILIVAGAIWLVLPRICEPQGLPIRGYGVMVTIAVSAAVGLAVWRGLRMGVDPEMVLTLTFWTFVPGIVGARTFYVIEYWPDFQRETMGATLIAIVNLTQGGLVVYGSILGGFLGFVGFVLKYRLPALPTLDLIAPSLLLGIALGRIGCLLNGCCFGGPCDLPWAVRFPPGSPPHRHQVRHGETFLHGLKIAGPPGAPPVITEVEPGSPAEVHGLESGQVIAAIGGYPVETVAQAQELLLGIHETGATVAIRVEGRDATSRWRLDRPPAGSEPVHPTQIYSAINALVLLLFVLAYAPFRRRDGELWALVITLYPATRILLEFIRTDEPGVLGKHLTISASLSLAVLVCAAGFWIYLLTRPRKTTWVWEGLDSAA
jgi:phosphatidylglycerol:prolipoprotein diacylglycerol transferase